MPPYRFLFEQCKIGRLPGPEALVPPADGAPAPGYEVVPTPAAKALAAYLINRRADAPLFNAPMTLPVIIGTATPTNTPPASASAK